MYSHVVIYFQQFHCTRTLEHLLQEPMEKKLTEMCSKTFMEAMILLNMGAAETNYRDFFMEEGTGFIKTKQHFLRNNTPYSLPCFIC